MFCFTFFFFNDTATTEIYTLSLHDALPISIFPQTINRPGLSRIVGSEIHAPTSWCGRTEHGTPSCLLWGPTPALRASREDRKSTRLNSSHANISYAVFCLKKKKQHQAIYSI